MGRFHIISFSSSPFSSYLREEVREHKGRLREGSKGRDLRGGRFLRYTKTELSKEAKEEEERGWKKRRRREEEGKEKKRKEGEGIKRKGRGRGKKEEEEER